MEPLEVEFKEDFYIDGFFIYPKGTKACVWGIRYEEPEKFQIYVKDLEEYHWIDKNILQIF